MKLESAVFEASFGRAQQLPPSDMPEIVFSGRSNVGKSSLINRLLNRKALARVSATPGKTTTINFYRLDMLRLVDLPGYGYAKRSKEETRRWSALVEGYFDSGRDIAMVVQLVDMRHPATPDDVMMLEFLIDRAIPFSVVLTKSDKLNVSQRKESLERFAQQLNFLPDPTPVLPFSAVKGEGVEVIREWMEKACCREDVNHVRFE